MMLTMHDGGEQHKNSQKKGQKPGNLADGGDQGVSQSRKNPIF
jgi:hypothetical protein